MRAIVKVGFKKAELVNLMKAMVDALFDDREAYILTIDVPDDNQIKIIKKED